MYMYLCCTYLDSLYVYQSIVAFRVALGQSERKGLSLDRLTGPLQKGHKYVLRDTSDWYRILQTGIRVSSPFLKMVTCRPRTREKKM